MCIKRRACFIGAVLFAVLIPLAVCANAALDPQDYNLVPHDILQWYDYTDNGDIGVGLDEANLVYMYSSNTSANVGSQHIATVLKISVPSGFLIPGNSYSISFSYPSDQQIIQHSRFNRTQSYINTNWSRIVAAVIGLAYIDDEGDMMLLDGCSVSFNHSESVKYTNGINYINFVMPNTAGKQIYFVVGYLRGGDNSATNPTIYFSRYYGLIDFERKQQLEEYNNIWYGNPNGNYTNPYTTESYNVGSASDTDTIDSALNQWEAGLGEFGTPLRVSGVFLNSLFSAGGIVTVGVIVLVILLFGVIFRLFGVT